MSEPETLSTLNYDVPTNAWEGMDLLTGSFDEPLEDCNPVPSPDILQGNIIQPTYLTKPAPGLEPTNLAVLTPAATFMQGRPAGPVQTTHVKMKALERRVTTQMQKKSTTAPQGHRALQQLSAQAQAGNNKENERGERTSKKKKMTRKTPVVRKKQKKASTPSLSKTPPRQNTPSSTSTVTAPVAEKPICTYGCMHDGLVELKQMDLYDTKFCLEKGNYFDSKSCIDCNKSVAEVFRISKNKALLYYCQLDYNIHNLQEDNAAAAETPCACILCIACYFTRLEEKRDAMGKARRSSGRGRRP